MLKRPMLAASTKAEDLTRLKYPMLASPKIDGVRALVVNGRLVSRTLKLIPNRYVQELFGRPEYEGLDGELAVGPVNDHNLMQATMSGVMSEDGRPDVTWNVFDDWKIGGAFESRLRMTERRVKCHENSRIRFVPHVPVVSYETMRTVEEAALADGYEGIMLRSLTGQYKQGRATFNSGDLLKVKRFVDGEAEVIGATELRHNGNAATVDERGFTKRSTHAANKQGGGVLGCLKVRDLSTGITFEIGTGFTWAQREEMWAARDRLPGLLVKYQHFTVGTVDKPRFPIFLGFRDRRDV